MTKNEKQLINIIEDILYMSIRYAHGRKTFAPHIVRGAVTKLKRIDPDFKVRKDDILKPAPEGVLIPGDYLNDLFTE